VDSFVYLSNIRCDVTTTPRLERQLSAPHSQVPNHITSLPGTAPISSYLCGRWAYEVT